MIFVCKQCGEKFRKARSQAERYGSHFCSRECYYESMRKKAMEKRAMLRREDLLTEGKNGEKRLPHLLTKIIITAEIPVYPWLRPKVGQCMQAEKYISFDFARTGYVIEINNTRVCVRDDECREL